MPLDQRASVGFLPCMSMPKCISGRETSENLGAHLSGDEFGKLMNQKSNNIGTAKNGVQSQLLPLMGINSPLILNHKVHRRLQASKPSVEKDPVSAVASETVVDFQQGQNLQKAQSECCNPHDIQLPARKRVRFSEAEVQFEQDRNLQKQKSTIRSCITKAGQRLKYSSKQSVSITQEEKKLPRNFHAKGRTKMIFKGIEFLLTGFSSPKEKKIEESIRKYGGIVLSDVPSPNLRIKRSSRSSWLQLPVVLSSKKLPTAKFLYGCAVSAFMLKIKWLTDSIAACSILPPQKYMILSNQTDGKCVKIGKPVCRNYYKYIFERLGIMFHGKHSFCTKLAKVVKHGGGHVFKTLQWLVQSFDSKRISVGAIIAEDMSRASRHLRHCASERRIVMMPASWIINSLYLGKLLPLPETNYSSTTASIKVPAFPVPMESSEEI